MLRLVTQWFNPPNLSHCDLLLRLLYFVEVDIERLIGNPMKDQTPRGVLESNMLVQPLFAFSDMVNAIDKKRSEFDAVLLRAREYADLLAALSVTQLSLLLTVELLQEPQSHLAAETCAQICFDQFVSKIAWPVDSSTDGDEKIAFAKVLAVLGALLLLRDDATCQSLAVWLSKELFTIDRIVTALFDDESWDGHVFVSTRVPRHGMSSHTKFLSSHSPGDSHGCLLFQPESGDARASRLQFGAPVLPPIVLTWSDFFAKNQLTEYGLVVANVSRPPPGERCRFYTSFSMRSHRLWIARKCQQSVAQIVVDWQNKAYSYSQHCWHFVDAMCKAIGCSRMRDAFVRRSAGFRNGIEGLVSDHTKHVAPSPSAPTGLLSSVGTPPVLWTINKSHADVDAAHDRFKETLFACRWNDSDLSPQYLADMDEFVAYALGVHVAHQLNGGECTLLDKRSGVISTQP